MTFIGLQVLGSMSYLSGSNHNTIPSELNANKNSDIQLKGQHGHANLKNLKQEDEGGRLDNNALKGRF